MDLVVVVVEASVVVSVEALVVVPLEQALVVEQASEAQCPAQQTKNCQAHLHEQSFCLLSL